MFNRLNIQHFFPARSNPDLSMSSKCSSRPDAGWCVQGSLGHDLEAPASVPCRRIRLGLVTTPWGKMMGHDYPVIRGVGVELGGVGWANNVRLRLFLPLYLRVHR